jgi:hypothetical protein
LGGRLNADKDDAKPSAIWKYDPYTYADNMNAIAEVSFADGTAVSDDDLLGAFIGSECIGIAKPVYNPINKSKTFFISISGGASTGNIRFRYYKNSEVMEYSVNETFAFVANDLKGTLKAPVHLTIDEQSGTGISAYPNPFSKEIAIAIRIPGNAEVMTEITDITGKPVRPMQPATSTRGIATITWDGKDNAGGAVSGGVYVLRVSINGIISNYRIIKL